MWLMSFCVCDCLNHFVCVIVDTSNIVKFIMFLISLIIKNIKLSTFQQINGIWDFILSHNWYKMQKIFMVCTSIWMNDQ